MTRPSPRARRTRALVIVVGLGVAVVVAVVLVLRLALWLPWFWESLQDGQVISQDPLTFDAPDQPPSDGVASGAYQSLTSAGWVPRDGSSARALVRPGPSGSVQTYADPTGVCEVTIAVRTHDLGQGGDYDESVSLLADFVKRPGSEDVLTGKTTLVLSPAYGRPGDGGPPGLGYGFYEVVRSPLTVKGSDGRGEVWARAFTGGSTQIGVTTAAICHDKESLTKIGIPALQRSVGAAW